MLSFQVIDRNEAPTASAALTEPPIIGLLAPHVRLEKFLEEPELVSVAVVADLRPAMRLPSPFEETALQRAARL